MTNQDIADELKDLREYVDSVVSDVFGLVADLQLWKEELNKRIEKYNTKTGHKF